MKKLILILTIVVMVTSCKKNTMQPDAESQTTQSVADVINEESNKRYINISVQAAYEYKMKSAFVVINNDTVSQWVYIDYSGTAGGYIVEAKKGDVLQVYIKPLSETTFATITLKTYCSKEKHVIREEKEVVKAATKINHKLK